jgi:hypothetical protein
MLLAGILTAEVISVTITGKKLPLVKPVKVTSVELPTGLTVIDVVVKAGLVTAPIYIAADLIFAVGKADIVSTCVAKSG